MSMMNIDSVTAHLSKMSPQQLQQFASMHMDDPIMLAAAKFVSNQQTKMQQSQQPAPGTPPKVNEQVVSSIAPQQMPQQQMPQQQMQPQAQQAPQQPQQPQAQQAPQQPQQPQMPPQAQGLPEDSGIAQLPAQNMQNMAEGGIVAFARGGNAGEYPTTAYRDYALQRAQEMGIDPTFADSIFNIESGYRPNAVSPTGPVGVGQLTKKTGEYYGVAPEDRKDPYKNIDASLAFMSDLQRKYKGDPEKMAVAYNQGETVLNKHLRANNGAINPAQLKPEAQGYLNKLGKFMTAAMPIGTAQAAPAPVPGKQPPAGIPSDITAGAGGKALMAGTGLAAIPAAASALRAPSMAVGPATAAAAGAGGPGTALQTTASRLSPYLRPASMGPAGPVIAGGAALATGAANALSNATPEQLEQLQGDIGSDTGLAAAIMNPANRGPQAPVSPTLAAARKAQAQDNTPSDTVYDPMTGIPMYGTETTTGDDRTFRERLGLGNVANRKANEELERILRLKNLPPTKAGAGRGMVNPREVTPEISEDLPKEAQKEVIATAKENVPEGTNTKGFTNEDWLNLGFGLLAGKSQYAMQNLGEAGIATLAAKQARTKAGIEARKAEADITQSGAMSKYYTAGAERYAAEDKPLAQARKELAAAYAKLETDELLKFDPAKLAAAKQQATTEIMARYPELKATMGLGSAGPALDLSKWGQPAKQ